MQHDRLVSPVYLCSPVTGLDPEFATRAASYWTNHLTALERPGLPRLVVWSPVLMGSHLTVDWSHDQWMAWCRPMFDACRSVAIAPVDGWEDSRGIAIERQWAREANKPLLILGRLGPLPGY